MRVNETPAYPRPAWFWRFADQIERFPILGLLLAGMVYTLLLRSVFDVDIFWQLKLGDLTLDEGRIPPTEPFVLPEGRPHVPIGWLAQVIYALARRVGGWQLAQVVDTAAWLGGLAAIAFSVRSRMPRAWPAAAALWIVFLVAASQASLRPQSFALLSFGLLFALVKSDWALWKKVIFGGLILVLWSNTHPSVVSGGAYLGVLAAVGWGKFLWTRTGRPPWTSTLLMPIAVGTLFATPAGADLISVAAYNAEICLKLDIVNTGEWRGLWDTEAIRRWNAGDWDGLWNWLSGTARVWAAVLLAITFVALLIRGRRVPLEDIAAAVLFAVLMILTYRFVLFWTAVLIPVWAAILAPSRPLPAPPRRVPGYWFILSVAFALAIAVAMLTKPSVLAEYLPIKGAEAMKKEGVRGTIYSHFEWGGVLADGGYPDWKLTHDGRYYLLSESEWREHFAALDGQIPVEDLERKYRPVAFFLRPGWGDALIEKLRVNPRWREVPSDENSAVFVRTTTEPRP